MNKASERPQVEFQGSSETFGSSAARVWNWFRSGQTVKMYYGAEYIVGKGGNLINTNKDSRPPKVRKRERRENRALIAASTGLPKQYVAVIGNAERH